MPETPESRPVIEEPYTFCSEEDLEEALQGKSSVVFSELGDVEKEEWYEQPTVLFYDEESFKRRETSYEKYMRTRREMGKKLSEQHGLAGPLGKVIHRFMTDEEVHAALRTAMISVLGTLAFKVMCVGGAAAGLHMGPAIYRFLLARPALTADLVPMVADSVFDTPPSVGNSSTGDVVRALSFGLKELYNEYKFRKNHD